MTHVHPHPHALTLGVIAGVATSFFAGTAGAQDIVYVNANLTTGADNGSSWANAYRGPLALKSALDNTKGSADLWVAAGVYTPSPADRFASFELRSGLGVFGGFAGWESHLDERDPAANITLLSGDLDGEDADHGGVGLDNAFIVARAVDCDDTTVLDGVTIYGAGEDSWSELGLDEANLRIEGGTPRIVGCTILEAAETATAMVDVVGGTPAIVGCRLDNSAANFPMAAMLFNRAGGAVSVVDCDFVSNPAQFSPALAVQNGETTPFREPDPPDRLACRAVLRGCTFTGLASVLDESELTVERSTFHGGHQAIISNGTNTVIDACTFRGCESVYNGGSAIFIGDFPPAARVLRLRATNCLMSGNDRDSGRSAVAGLGLNDQCSITLINCTLVSNGRADRPYAAVAHFGRGSVRVRNCILWGNFSQSTDVSAQLIDFPEGAPDVAVDNSCLQFWNADFPGVGTIALSPLFQDIDGPDNIRGTPDDNLRLGVSSPCVDTGRNALVPKGILLDLVGQVRFLDADANGSRIVDMGAYERERFGGAGVRRLTR